MIILLIIGILIFVVKIISLILKAAFSLVGGILIVIGLPFILIALVIGGLIYVALPVLLVALLVAFLIPLFKGI